MTRCWILYDRDDLMINGFFAGRLLERATDLGMCTRIVTVDDMPDGTPDAVINRSRDWRAAERLERMGSRVFNGSTVCRICNDKYETYRLADSVGVPHLQASLPGEVLPEGPPWVVKSRTGHGGTEVFRADSEEEVGILCGKIDRPLIQRFGTPGRDMRAYVLDGEILATVMRSNDRDFRANYKLGGDIALCEAPDHVGEMVEAICDRLRPDFIGIDFVFDGEEAVLNEIEDAVGTRMLYSLTSIDAAALLAEHVHSKMSL